MAIFDWWKSKCKHQKKNKRKKIFKIFFLLESVVSWLQITRSVPKKGLRKVSKAFFVWLVSFRQKLHKSAELLKRRGPVTGIFYLMNSDVFAHQTNCPSYYYKDLLVLLPRNSLGTMPHLYLSLSSSSPIKCNQYTVMYLCTTFLPHDAYCWITYFHFPVKGPKEKETWTPNYSPHHYPYFLYCYKC